ncbi:glycosyltransferase family 2 protein [Rossellomorea sp. NPDC077527]|uniref:glycosyltransferase family 2 protein n=1 Tax=Rossellomorea sp. NPDC077527 TaxID=3364510 RepID=UPI0037C6E7D1
MEKQIFPLISVIIPTFNRAYIIQRTIKSVLDQSYENIEIIVIDDGSTDNTEEIINLIKVKHKTQIKYVKLKKNSNGAVARNAGIENARGEYIAFLDSDDFWEKRKLEKQYQYLSSYKNVNNIVCYSKLIADRGKIKKIMPQKGIGEKETVGEYLFVNNGLIQTSTLMLPTELAKKVKFDPNLKKHQDWDYCLRLESEGVKFIFLEEALSNYDLKDKDNISKKNDYRFSLEWIKKVRPLVTDKAYFAFIGKYISVYAGREGKKVVGLKICLSAFLNKSISVKDLIITQIKILIPSKLIYIIVKNR